MLVIFSESYAGGGAERVLALLANSWTTNDGPIRLISLSNANVYLKDGLTAEVYCRKIVAARKLNRVLNILTAAKSINSKSSVLICSYFLLLVLTPIARLKGFKIIFRPSIDFNYIRDEITSRFGPRIGYLLLAALRTSLSSSSLIYQTQSIKNSFADIIYVRKPGVVIPNPVSFDAHSFPAYSRPTSLSPLDILLVGRLVPEKGFDRIISGLKHSASGVRLHLYGDGPEKEALIRQAHQSGIELIPYGFTNLRNSKIDCAVFVVPSRVEGFPNVVLEAALAGWPIIVSSEVNDCIYGSPVASLCESMDFDEKLSLEKLMNICNRHTFDDSLSAIFSVQEKHSVENFKSNLINLL